MENENTQIVKPSIGLSILMYLFLMVLVWCLFEHYDAIDSLSEQILMGYDTIVVVSAFLIDIFMYVYGVIAIYKTLQRKSYGIGMLKMAVFYLALQHTFRSLGLAGMASKLYFCMAAVFEWFFFLYLLKAKSLKVYLPSNMRTFGVYGICGLSLYVMVGGLYGMNIWQSIMKQGNSSRMNVAKMELDSHHYTDGLYAFQTPESWVKDSIKSNKDGEALFVFHSSNAAIIQMTTALGECRSRLDFYQLVFQANVKTLDFREVDYGERQINGATFYYSTYEYLNRKGKKMYWSFSSLVDTDSYKILCLSQIEANSPKQSLYDAIEIMGNAKSCLKE